MGSSGGRSKSARPCRGQSKRNEPIDRGKCIVLTVLVVLYHGPICRQKYVSNAQRSCKIGCRAAQLWGRRLSYISPAQKWT
jgi:hypothetical protein